MIEIREMDNNDEAGHGLVISLYRSHRKEWDCTQEEFEKILKLYIALPNTRTFMAYHDGQPVGFITTRRNNGWMNQIEVLAGNILPSGMFKEIIRAFLHTLEKWARETGAKRVSWAINVDLDTWKRHFKKLGFNENDLRVKQLIAWEIGG